MAKQPVIQKPKRRIDVPRLVTEEERQEIERLTADDREIADLLKYPARFRFRRSTGN